MEYEKNFDTNCKNLTRIVYAATTGVRAIREIAISACSERTHDSSREDFSSAKPSMRRFCHSQQMLVAFQASNGIDFSRCPGKRSNDRRRFKHLEESLFAISLPRQVFSSNVDPQFEANKHVRTVFCALFIRQLLCIPLANNCLSFLSRILLAHHCSDLYHRI